MSSLAAFAKVGQSLATAILTIVNLCYYSRQNQRGAAEFAGRMTGSSGEQQWPRAGLLAIHGHRRSAALCGCARPNPTWARSRPTRSTTTGTFGRSCRRTASSVMAPILRRAKRACGSISASSPCRSCPRHRAARDRARRSESQRARAPHPFARTSTSACRRSRRTRRSLRNRWPSSSSGSRTAPSIGRIGRSSSPRARPCRRRHSRSTLRTTSIASCSAASSARASSPPRPPTRKP